MIQEAHAVASAYSSSITGAVGGDSTATTNLVVTFDQAVYTPTVTAAGNSVDKSSLFSVTGYTVNTANIIEEDNDTCAAGATATVTLVLSTALGTGDTPTVSFTNDGTVDSCENLAGSTDATNFVTQTPTDGLRPVVSSAATTSSTTIALTMSEDVTVDSAIAGDFTIAGVASTPTVTGLAGSGSSTLTLTLDAAIVNGESPTVTYTLNARVIDDGATGNQLAAFAGQAVTNNVAAVVVQANNGGGGSGCNDCEAPTLGIDKSGQRLVSNGFTYNSHSVDVERFFTPYPLIKANVGQTNKADFKIYENEGPENIKHFSFAFGLGKDQIISESKAMIELDIDWDGTETVTVTDPENALDNVKVETYTISCEGDVQIDCLGVTIYHTFRAPLDFNIVATDVWDNSRNSWQNYYNHGIEVVGKSLNPAKEYDGINKGHIYHLTETSKTTAVDEFGNSWSMKYGLWNMDYIKNYNNPVILSLNDIVLTDNGLAGSDQFGTKYYLTEISKTTAVDMFGSVWLLEDNQWSMDEKYSTMILDSTPMGGYTRADPEFDTYKYGQFLLAENKLTEIMGN